MTIKSYKGFDANMSCRGMKFEVGKEYIHDGDVKACESGFHACEYPLDVLSYYPPATSLYAEVEQDGTLARRGDDSKVASSVLRIKGAVAIAGLVKAAIEYTLSRSKLEGKSATGGYGAASATGDRGAASATGLCGKVKGADGCALLLVERDEYGKVLSAAGAVVGKKGIKPDTWYTLKRGKFVKVKP